MWHLLLLSIADILLVVRTGINTEVSRYILGIGNTKQLTTNTIYRIGSLLYILARIDILGGGSGGEQVWLLGHTCSVQSAVLHPEFIPNLSMVTPQMIPVI